MSEFLPQKNDMIGGKHFTEELVFLLWLGSCYLVISLYCCLIFSFIFWVYAFFIFRNHFNGVCTQKGGGC